MTEPTVTDRPAEPEDAAAVDPIDAFLNMLPGNLGDDRKIVAALDRLIDAERAEARLTNTATPGAEVIALLGKHEAMGCCDPKTLEHVAQSLRAAIDSWDKRGEK